MAGLFTPDLSDAEGVVVRVRLDPRHALLADHRVGGRPLLSTVLSVEAMASAFTARHPEQTVVSVEQVEVGPPLFVDRPLAATVTVAATGPDRFSLRLGSVEGRHLSADLILGRREPRVRSHLPAGPGHETVEAPEIYALFFHGPAFRVVERVWWSGEELVGELSRGCPALRESQPATVTAPLLTELCLQTAGLRELAVRGVMDIPHSIRRITRRSGRDAGDAGGRLRAVVRPATGTAGGPSLDADVIDDDGYVHLEVRGYRTTPLDVPFDEAAAAIIRRRLNSVPAS